MPDTLPRPGRDHRVDFFRGIALVMIFVNHVPGNVWERATTRNLGFSDSAELFVFLAGFASAFAYGRLFQAGGMLVASLKALRRAGVLYGVHIVITMLCAALFANMALATGNGRYLAANGVGYFLSMPLDMMARVPLLGYHLAYVNILPMYSVLLALLPLMLLALRSFGARGLLALSAALWLACGIWRFNLPNWTYSDGWGFNPFAWQLVFAIGLACGDAATRGERLVPFRRPLYALALGYLALAFLFCEFGTMEGTRMALPLPDFLADLDKTHAPLARTLHLLALVYVFSYAPAESVFARVSATNPLTRLGRHSLPVFATGTMLAFVAQVAMYEGPVDPLRDTVLVGGGLALQFALAGFLDWWVRAERAARAPAPGAERAARPPRPGAAAAAMPDLAPAGAVASPLKS